MRFYAVKRYAFAHAGSRLNSGLKEIVNSARLGGISANDPVAGPAAAGFAAACVSRTRFPRAAGGSYFGQSAGPARGRPGRTFAASPHRRKT